MNDVTYLEAARKMAERMMREGGSTPAARIGFGFELATARKPVKREAEILLSSSQLLSRFLSKRSGGGEQIFGPG